MGLFVECSFIQYQTISNGYLSWLMTKFINAQGTIQVVSIISTILEMYLKQLVNPLILLHRFCHFGLILTAYQLVITFNLVVEMQISNVASIVIFAH